MKRYLTEFLGTFFLVLTIHGIVVSGNNAGGIAIGIALAALVYMGGAVSGAHYNPAVTIALWFLKKLETKDLGPYIIAQLLGAIAASAIGSFAFGDSFAVRPALMVSPAQAVVIELLFTSMLVLTILNVAVAKKTAGNPYFGFAIGGVIVAAALAGGPFSGGAFNPAVGTGPTLVHSLLGKGNLASMWIYWVGPVLGAILAATLFRLQEPATVPAEG